MSLSEIQSSVETSTSGEQSSVEMLTSIIQNSEEAPLHWRGVWRTGTQLEEGADFSNANFREEASFNNAEFGGHTRFQYTEFSETRLMIRANSRNSTLNRTHTVLNSTSIFSAWFLSIIKSFNEVIQTDLTPISSVMSGYETSISSRSIRSLPVHYLNYANSHAMVTDPSDRIWNLHLNDK